MIANTSDILRRLAAYGVRLTAVGRQIQIKGRASARVIRSHRRALLDALAGRHSDIELDLPADPVLKAIGAGYLVVGGQRAMSTPTGDDPLIDVALGLVTEGDLIAAHEARTRQANAMHAAWKRGELRTSQG